MNGIETHTSGSFNDIKRGFCESKESFVCNLCGEVIEKGIIYKEDGIFFDSEKAMKKHIEKIHESVFAYLIKQDKKTTGLSEHQSTLMQLLFEGSSDARIQQEMSIGSSSTVRNHRFLLKEKEKHAKLLLILMELIRENRPNSNTVVKTNTEDVDLEILVRYFTQGLNGPLTTINIKEKNKLVIIKHISTRFLPGKIYTEKEVNEVLKMVHPDFVHLRRFLIEYRFMDRKKDGSEYWVIEGKEAKEAKEAINKIRGEEKVDRKKELALKYKEIEIEAGVYLIKNKMNGKVGVFSTPNLRTINGKLLALKAGGHMNKKLQSDWNEFGEENFAFEVAEVLEKKAEESGMGRKDRLEELETKWIKKLEPFDEKGYNKSSR